MNTGKAEVYCEYCGAPPPYHSPCRQSADGSHRWHVRGEKRYRVRSAQGFTWLSFSPPQPPDELIEVIEY